MKFLAFFGVLLAAQLVASSLAPQSLADIEEQLALVEQMQKMEDLTPEDRFFLGAVASWLKEKAVVVAIATKDAFIKQGGLALLQQCKSMISNFVTMENMTCEENACQSCVTVNMFPLNGKKACMDMSMSESDVISVNVTYDGSQLVSHSLNLGAVTASCFNLVSPLGEVCLQGLKQNSSEGICMTAVMSQFMVGQKFCVKWENGQISPSMSSVDAVAVQDRLLITLNEGDVTLVNDLAI